jgi:hypothetical protein
MRSILMVMMAAVIGLFASPASALEQGSGAVPGQACRSCKNDCYDSYPAGGGPRQTCLNLCSTGACSGGGGRVASPTIQKKHIGQPKYDAVQSQSKGPLNTSKGPLNTTATPALQGNVLQKSGGAGSPVNPGYDLKANKGR